MTYPKMSRPPPNPVFTFKGNMKPVHSLMFDLNECAEIIYAGTQDGKIHLWDLKWHRLLHSKINQNIFYLREKRISDTNKEIKTYSVGTETCLAIHKLKTDDINNLLITQEKNGIYRFWCESDLNKELSLVKELNSSYYGFCRSVITQDNDYIICPCNEAKIQLVAINKCGKDIVIDDDKIKSVGEIMVVKSISGYIFVTYESGAFNIWSLDSKKCLHSSELISDCPMAFDISESSSGKLYGFIGSNSDAIQEFIVDIHGEITVTKRRELRLTNPGVSSIRIRKDNKLFAASCWDKRLRLFSCKSLKLLVVLDFHKDVIQEIVFSNSKVSYWNSDKLLAAASVDGRISMWDLY